MELNVVNSLVLSKDKVTSQTFPTYAPPNVKDDMVGSQGISSILDEAEQMYCAK